MKSNQLLQVKNMAENQSELYLYGDVVESVPVDFWTGEKIPGDFIALESVKSAIAKLRDKTDITVHLNSGGGDYYAGLAVKNELKALNANITVIIDSLAASAASVIAMAGDTIKVYPDSVMMIHPASAFLYGWYTQSDAELVNKNLDACKRSCINAYADKNTVKTKEEIENAVQETTWLVGDEIVEFGLADEVIQNSTHKVEMKIENNKNILISNGVKHHIASCGNIPDFNKVGLVDKLSAKITELSDVVKNMAKQNTVDIRNEEIEPPQERIEKMCKTVEELKSAYPELVAQLEKTVTDNVRNEEKTRIKEIDEIVDTIDDKELVAKAKYSESESMTAKDLAFIAMKQQKAAGNTYLAGIQEDNEKSNVDKVQTSSSTLLDDETKEAEDLAAAFKQAAVAKNGK